MKPFLLILLFSLILDLSFQKAEATEYKSLIGLGCAAASAQTLSRQLPAGGDKFKHCTLSCQLAKICGYSGTTSIGIIKEISDLFTDGNAEFADLRANFRGMRLSLSTWSYNKCPMLCRKYYQ